MSKLYTDWESKSKAPDVMAPVLLFIEKFEKSDPVDAMLKTPPGLELAYVFNSDISDKARLT